MPEDNEVPKMPPPAVVAGMDQLSSLINDVIPSALRSFHRRLIDEGFSEEQALLLTAQLMNKLIGAR